MKTHIWGVFIGVLLAGCGTSPEPDYYVLKPVEGGISAGMVVPVRVERPLLPDYLDRPDIVRQTDDDQVSMDEMRRWASPLDLMVEDILAQDLRQRLPGSSVTTERDDPASQPHFTVSVDIQNFNATAEGALLAAEIYIKDPVLCGPSTTADNSFRVTSAEGSVEDLSALLGKMADRIANLMQARKAAQQACCLASPAALCNTGAIPENFYQDQN